MIENDEDAATGLLNRRAFLREVAELKQQNASTRYRGCLLILQFPVIKSLKAAGKPDDPGDDAIRHLLAVLETRTRTRDSVGRVARHSLCILLRGCQPPNAVIVADQYAALLRDIVISDNGKQLPMQLRYRVVSLDKEEQNSISGATRVVLGPPVDVNTRLTHQFEVTGNKVDFAVSKVVSLNSARAGKKLAQGQHDNANTGSGSLPHKSGKVLQLGIKNQNQFWRMRPGMLLLRKPLVCCHRLQAVGRHETGQSLRTMPFFTSILNALALNRGEVRPRIESQIILPVDSVQIDADFPQWVADSCKQLRVAPSDICLSLDVDSLALNLRRVGPLLRQLNHSGIRLMLEGASSASQLKMAQRIAQFDYLYLSGRAITDSLTQVNDRVQLDALIDEAKAGHCEICAGGMDSTAVVTHALAMRVDIGFGRECGPSAAFPTDI